MKCHEHKDFGSNSLRAPANLLREAMKTMVQKLFGSFFTRSLLRFGVEVLQKFLLLYFFFR
jgi:hypothetical protein